MTIYDAVGQVQAQESGSVHRSADESAVAGSGHPAFGGLRFGEATALRRSDVPSGGRLRIERSVRRVGGEWAVGEPETDAGYRTDTIPVADAAVVEDHLEKHVDAAPDKLIFSTSSGSYLARSNWNQTLRRAAEQHIRLEGISPSKVVMPVLPRSPAPRVVATLMAFSSREARGSAARQT